MICCPLFSAIFFCFFVCCFFTQQTKESLELQRIFNNLFGFENDQMVTQGKTCIYFVKSLAVLSKVQTYLSMTLLTHCNWCFNIEKYIVNFYQSRIIAILNDKKTQSWQSMII